MRALFSAHDKTGLAAFAAELSGAGWEIVATGGTAAELEQAGVAHLDVSEVTGAPEMLGGRVKTLHPSIHAAILADRSDSAHLAELETFGIEQIDLVVCNLYPFRSSPSIETIDIGGVTMLRAAAKNSAHVAAVVDPDDYPVVLEEILREGAVSQATRLRLAATAFAHTAEYDAAIASWFEEKRGTVLPDPINLALVRRDELRYGENPHQFGARYGPLGEHDWWDEVVQHSGVELSYLNLVDAEAAWRLCHSVIGIGCSSEAAVIVKHANPCGVAIGRDPAAVYAAAFEADPVSAFGGIVAVAGRIDASLAAAIIANPIADVLIASSYDEDALSELAEKRKRMRVLSSPAPIPGSIGFRQFAGGFLVQQEDTVEARSDEWKVVTERKPTDKEWQDAELAWRVCAQTTSNAVVLAKQGRVVGVGCGQQNRRDAARLATEKANGRALGGAGASDAYFPFRDGLDAVCESGVTVVVQPGGSIRDEEVIAAANERGVAMVFTGRRHFRH